QHHAADQLDVEMPLAEGALGRLADGGEGWDQDVIEGLAVGELFAECRSAGLQRVIRQSCELGLERVDGVDAGLISSHAAIIGGAEELAGERADHTEILSLPNSWA